MIDLEQGLLGWATAPLLRLDVLAPGLVRRVLTVSPMRRQAIFAVLAEQPSSSDPMGENEEARRALAGVLLRERAREILTFYFGGVPDGWLGGLERIGDAPLDSPLAYARLRAIYADGSPQAAEALRYVGAIDARRLAVLDTLDTRWVHTQTLKRLDSLDAARDFNAAVAFAQRVCSRASDDAVYGAITRLAEDAPLSAIVQRFMRRADRFPPQPFESAGELRPLDTVRALVEAGRRYRNCLTSKVEEVLAGQAAYAEFRDKAILEFRPLTGGFGWLLTEVHFALNGRVPQAIMDAASAACLDLGIPAIEERTSGAWRSYNSLTGFMGLFA